MIDLGVNSMTHNHAQAANDDPHTVSPDSEDTYDIAPKEGAAFGTLKTLGSITYDTRGGPEYRPDEYYTEDEPRPPSDLSRKVEKGSLWIISKFGISSIGFVILIFVVFKVLDAFKSIP